jgi:hypothetical protein
MPGKGKVAPATLANGKQVFDRRTMRWIVIARARYKTVNAKAQRLQHILQRAKYGALRWRYAFAGYEALGIIKGKSISHLTNALSINALRNKSDVGFTQCLFGEGGVALN